MSKFVIRKQYGDALSAGEVSKETERTFFTERIEGCPGFVSGRFPKSEMIFETDDKVKIIRIMAVYSLLRDQHLAVTKATDDTFKWNIAILTGHGNDPVKPNWKETNDQKDIK